MMNAAATVQPIGTPEAVEPSTPVDPGFPYPFPEFKPWLCCICDHPAAPWAPYYCCWHWPSGEPDNPWERPYNENFTEGEARLLWEILQELRHRQGRPVLPFPLDRPTPSKGSGERGIFEKLHQIDLAEWAGKYTTLHPMGPGRWKGLCPLHQERTGSFYVHADPWRWRCFGACAMGGDIVTLAQQVLHLDSVSQAIDHLAK